MIRIVLFCHLVEPVQHVFQITTKAVDPQSISQGLDDIVLGVDACCDHKLVDPLAAQDALNLPLEHGAAQ